MEKEAGAIASQLVTRGYRDKNEGLVEKGKAMYDNPDNFSDGQFDAAFEQE